MFSMYAFIVCLHGSMWIEFTLIKVELSMNGHNMSIIPTYLDYSPFKLVDVRFN